MIESLRNAFALPDLRRRIVYTIIVLIIYRLAANIPVPGVDMTAWLAFTRGQTTTNNLIEILNLLSGGAVRRFSVMAMGVYPYITASIIIQLLTPIIPQLEEMASEGEQGRNRINKLTYYLTVPLALLQAVGQIQLVGTSLGGVNQIMPFFGFTPASNILPTLTTLLAMTGGTMFAIWLGELITENGVGQGVSGNRIHSPRLYHYRLDCAYARDRAGHRGCTGRAAAPARTIRPARTWSQGLSGTEHAYSAQG
jgi:preprotein translocase subunit SecY